MWTGILIPILHVEAVGLHEHSAGQPWTKFIENLLGKPSGGIVGVPVSHLIKSFSVTFAVSKMNLESNLNLHMLKISNALRVWPTGLGAEFA